MSDSETIRSLRFRQSREADWRKLEGLLETVEKRGLSGLDFSQADELSLLYRQAMNSLSLAREVSLDKALLDYLGSLCVRSYLAVYAPRETLSGLVARFFRSSAPRALRRSWVALLVAFFLMLAGGLAGFWLTASDPSWYYAFVPGGLGGQRGPEASEEMLRSVLYSQTPVSLERLASFSTSLFAHNTQVAIFSYALGVIAGLPAGFLMFYNGTILGAFFAIHDAKGLSGDLFGWISIHGVTEIPALIIAAAGGLRLGGAVLFPGNMSRSLALRRAGRDSVKLAIIAAIMLLVAGILEGIFRQLITDLATRVIIGWGIGALWLAWFVLAGRDLAQDR